MVIQKQPGSTPRALPSKVTVRDFITEQARWVRVLYPRKIGVPEVAPVIEFRGSAGIRLTCGAPPGYDSV